MTPPRVAAIMPVFNGEPDLAASIGSAAAQTTPPFEMIVVDDGSSDGSVGLTERLETRFPSACCGSCMAASRARNVAAGMAAGDYLAFRAVGGFDERLAGYEDDDLFLRRFRAGWSNVFLPDSLVRYRRHLSSSAFSERMWRSRERWTWRAATPPSAARPSHAACAKGSRSG